jgi:hypothetical protein
MIVWIRVGNVALIIAALVLIWLNAAHQGHPALTVINAVLGTVNLAMLWWSRDL